MTLGVQLATLAVASAVRGAVVLAATLITLSCMRRTSAARRHAVILGAIAAQLMIPLFAMIPDRVAVEFVSPSVAARMGAVESVVHVVSPHVPIVGEPAETAAAAANTPLDQLPLIIWLAGASMVALWAIGARARVWRVSSRVAPADATALYAAVRDAKRVLGETRSIEVLLSGDVQVPVTWGIIRPRILLPADAARWSGDRLRVVMLHETAHISRGDVRAQLFASIALVVFWFNPLLWLAVRRLRSTAERAADDMVMRSGVAPSAYVDTLLDIVKQLRHGPALGATLALARRGEFEGRMMAVLADRADRAPLGRRLGLTLGLGVLVIAAVAGIVRGQLPGATSTRLAGSLLSIAERSRGDIATLEALERVVASGSIGGHEVDRYLAVVSGIGKPIPRGMAIRALAEAVPLDSARLATTLDLVAPISSPVERSVSLASIARTQTLGATHRGQYYVIAASLSGPALTSALDALR